ncbi:hypothetical protein PC39_12862 [Salinisphaera sp. PC39]|uniref:hypothetical protein n=1 Tax=Salinisphaera sp. PC39 TaxID=1304156 RepID=UPI00333ED6C9
MRRKLIASTCLAAVLTAASLPGHAHEEGGDWLDVLFAAAGERNHDHDDRRRELRLSDRERDLIRDYYRDHDRWQERGRDHRGLPPGLQKKVARGEPLPPGWQKKIARGEVLPGDVYRYRQPLPGDLLRRLPRQPDGTELYRIDDDIVRVIVGTRVLADILDL